MIQPNEKLLPGNVVMYHSEPLALTISAIWHISKDSFFSEKYDPIPLTPEILVKWCGFVKNFYYYRKQLGKIKIAIDFDNTSASIWQGEGNVINIMRPEHLHTLQNTVYFLSGEEMPVNIPNN